MDNQKQSDYTKIKCPTHILIVFYFLECFYFPKLFYHLITCFRHYDVLAKTPSRMTMAATTSTRFPQYQVVLAREPA